MARTVRRDRIIDAGDCYLDNLLAVGTGCNDILMRENNSFGFTSAARSVHDTGDIDRTRGRGIDWIRIAEIHEILVRYDVFNLASFCEQSEKLFLCLAMINYIMQVRNRCENLSKSWKKRCIGENGPRFGLGKGLNQAFFTQGCICSDNRKGLGNASLSKDLPFSTTSAQREMEIRSISI